MQVATSSGSRCTRPARSVSRAREERRELVARPRVEQNRLGPALARAQHVAVGEAAAGGEAGKSARRPRPAMMSLMCTSTASKPARSNAAAISTWPLTPCSRRIATRGRAPVAMNGAATSSSGSNVSRGASPGSARSSMPRVFLVGAVGVVAQPLQLRGWWPTRRDAGRRATRRARPRRAAGCARARPPSGRRGRAPRRRSRRTPPPPAPRRRPPPARRRPAPRRTAQPAARRRRATRRRGRSARRSSFPPASRTGRRRRGRGTRAACGRARARAPSP